MASLMGMRRGARCIVHHRSASRTQPPGLPYTSAPAIVTIAVEDIEHPPPFGRRTRRRPRAPRTSRSPGWPLPVRDIHSPSRTDTPQRH